MTRVVLQKSVLGFSDFSEISGNCKRSGNTNVSGERFPARAQKIQNGILRNPPGAPNGAFLAGRAGIRKVLWKLLEISIFNPDRPGASHFTSKTQPCPQDSSISQGFIRDPEHGLGTCENTKEYQPFCRFPRFRPGGARGRRGARRGLKK